MLFSKLVVHHVYGFNFGSRSPVTIVGLPSSFHRLDMTLAVAEALNPNKPNQNHSRSTGTG